MAKKSDNYESLVAEIIEDIKKSKDIQELGHGRSNRLEGASGQSHQVDVSFIDNSYQSPKLVLIECKLYRSKSVDVSVPKILVYNGKDLIKNPKYPNKYKLIIVTNTSLQVGANRLMEYEDITYQKLNDEPPYGFSYEEIIILKGLKEEIQTGEYVNVEISPPDET